jgi:hypothetical protein
MVEPLLALGQIEIIVLPNCHDGASPANHEKEFMEAVSWSYTCLRSKRDF